MRIFVALFCVFVCASANAQHTPNTLKADKMLAELNAKTSYFDSVLIIDKAVYWRDLKIKGYGFKGKSIFKVDILLTENADNELHVRDLAKKKISKPREIQKLLRNDYPSVSKLSDDSLNLRPPRLSLENQEIWTVLMVNNKLRSQTLKQSYAPLFYQKTIPTRQRRFFIEFVQNVESGLK